MIVLPLVGIAIVCYLIGSIPFGLILGKLQGVDIREAGSGNIGATNVWRTCGPAFGIVCFVLDFLKGLLPVILALLFAAWREFPSRNLVPLIAPLSTVVGHVFPVWLKFRGGKGIATSAGALVPIAPLPLGIAAVVWALTLAIGRYMSVASITAAVALAVSGFAFITGDEDSPKLVLVVFLAAVAIWRHRANINRLRKGKEPRFSLKKGAPAPPAAKRKKKRKKKVAEAQPVQPVELDAANIVRPADEDDSNQ